MSYFCIFLKKILRSGITPSQTPAATLPPPLPYSKIPDPPLPTNYVKFYDEPKPTSRGRAMPVRVQTSLTVAP